MKKNKDRTIFYVDGATTVCLLQQDGEVVARGIAICSRCDWENIKVGKDSAHKRALEARGRKADCCEIKLEEIDRLGWFDILHVSLARDRFGDFKGYYNPKLTPTEEIITNINIGSRI